MFKTKQIRTQILGDRLKNARESMKMALWQASKKTRIPVEYLKNLEEGNYDRLPADVYIVAYLKKYAEALNLGAEEIIEQLRTERGITANLLSSTTSKSQTRFVKRPFLVLTPKRMGLVVAIIFIAVIFGYFWHQLSYLIYPPFIKITQPVSDFTTRERLIEISGQTGSDAYLTINGKEVYVDDRGYFQSVINLEVGLNLLKIEAKDRLGKTNTVTRRVMVAK